MVFVNLKDNYESQESRILCCVVYSRFKGIDHFEIHFWYVLAYLKGIQDVNVFVFAVVSILILLKPYKYCLFSHTNCSFRVLGHQCVLTFKSH